MFAALASIAIATAHPLPPDCSYDSELELARDAVAFDQVEGQGWRPLYHAGCYVDAAELLRAWQAENGGELDLGDPRERALADIMVWHEAQMWAFAERTDLALPLFEQTYRDSERSRTWNLYVDGTLAFLRRDKPALEAAMAELAGIPKPPGWDNAVDQEGQPVSLPWPQNFDVLEGLHRCWNNSYAVAYLCRDIPPRR